MRKLLLSILMLTVLGLWTNAQTIENFESITMNIFSGGENGAISVVANPDTVGNPSMYVGKMVRGHDGDPWAGWYATLPTPVDVTANRYVHLKLWKPRISPIVFKYEREGGNSGDVNPMTPQTSMGMWEEFVFNMDTVSGDYVKIVLIPDFEDPLTLTEDIVLYFDALYVNDDPTVGSDPVQCMENFETIPLNYMLNGENDMSYMELIPNPDQSGVNLSPYVIHFFRDMDGFPWDGFWSNLPAEIDVTDNKYVHVKVWKPRISPVKFKIEGGAAGTIEMESMYPQTMTNAWEDMVFDFSEKTGTYPIIALMPDFADPVGLTEDISIYFDDIVLNNDPNPITPPSQKINVDMTEAGLVEGDSVWLSGALGGIHGTWEQPGTNMNNLMLDDDADGVYSITLALPEGTVAFKFFIGGTWDNGDPAPGGDRTLDLTNTMDVFYKWGVDGEITPPESPTIQWTVNMSYQIAEGNFIEGIDFLDVAGSFNGWGDPGSEQLEALGDGLYGITIPDFTIGDTIEYKFRINGDWATSEFPDGGANRRYGVADGLNEINVWYNDEMPPVTSTIQWTVNMSYQIAEGNFVEGTDFLEVAGSFNDWNGESHHLESLGDSLYGITVPDFTAGDTIQYKFRINGDEATSEFPDGPNRTYTVIEGQNEITVWYNNDVTGINELETFVYNIYPNPVNETLNIDNLVDVTTVEIFNVNGQLVKSFINTNAVEQTQINTSDLKSGMYILTVHSGNSSASTKLMKY